MLDGRHRRVLDRQRAAPREPQRPGHAADRARRVRETIPDEILSDGRRGRADRPHARGADRAPARRQGLPARARARRRSTTSSRSRTSSALRETALRQVAEDVEVKRLVRETRARCCGATRRARRAPTEPAPQAIAERLLALATLDRESEHVVRRAWRSAQRLDAELDVLVVRPPGRAPSAEDRAPPGGAAASHLDARRAAAGRGGRRRGGGRDRRRAGARQHLRADRHAAAQRRGLARLRPRRRVAAHAACSTACRASTCGSSPTRRCGVGGPAQRR